MRRFDYDSLDSTNAEARRLIAQHPGEALLVTAATQTSGRGRLGRAWQSPRGGLWMSLVWPMQPKLGPDHYQPVPLVAALGAFVTLLRHVKHDGKLEIKWPNDLLLNRRKIAGILCEQVLGARLPEGAPPTLILGIGVNANFPVGALSGELTYPATTLQRELDREVDLAVLLEGIVTHTVELLTRFDRHGLTPPMLDTLRDALAMRGEEVRVSLTGGQTLLGQLTDLDDHGRLMLQMPDGPHWCEAGEVVTARPAEDVPPEHDL